jgi:hypothetical protein
LCANVFPKSGYHAMPVLAVRIVTATGASGMTLSFGIAEQTLHELGV